MSSMNLILDSSTSTSTSLSLSKPNKPDCANSNTNMNINDSSCPSPSPSYSYSSPVSLLSSPSPPTPSSSSCYSPGTASNNNSNNNINKTNTNTNTNTNIIVKKSMPSRSPKQTKLSNTNHDHHLSNYLRDDKIPHNDRQSFFDPDRHLESSPSSSADLPTMPRDLRPSPYHPSDKLPFRNQNQHILEKVDAKGYPPTNFPPTPIRGWSPFQPTQPRRNPVTYKGYGYLRDELEPRLQEAEKNTMQLFKSRGHETVGRIEKLGTPTSSSHSSPFSNSGSHSPYTTTTASTYTTNTTTTTTSTTSNMSSSSPNYFGTPPYPSSSSNSFPQQASTSNPYATPPVPTSSYLPPSTSSSSTYQYPNQPYPPHNQHPLAYENVPYNHQHQYPFPPSSY